MSIPAFVLFRDRVSYAKACVASLREAGLEVFIVDFDSTWPPALDWLAREHRSLWASPTRGKPFQHPYELWTSGLLRWLIGPDQPYIVTDCDVVPEPGLNERAWPKMLEQALDDHPEAIKAGLSLSLDLPGLAPQRDAILSWERQYWIIRKDDGCYVADTDTTVALYRPLGKPSDDNPDRYPGVAPAVRLAPPFTAQHLPWHETAGLSDELAYYRDHIIPGVSHWTR